MTSISHVFQGKSQSVRKPLLPESAVFHRGRLVNVLFVYRDARAADDCLQELTKAQFEVNSDVVLNLNQCAAQLRFKSYDFIVVEYPSPSCKGSQMLRLLDQTRREIPLIVLGASGEHKSIADLVPLGAFECVERTSINCQWLFTEY